MKTELHHDFIVYPKQLRHIIEEEYNNEVYRILDSVKNGDPLVRDATYHIHRGARFDPGEVLYRSVGEEVFPNAIMANIEALKKFIKMAPSKKLFLKAAEAKLANPEYTQLHSVPPGHMGWGMDTFGCLSLRLTTIEADKLKHQYIYVQRKAAEAVKVEDDDECQIVEKPSAANE